MRTNAEWLEAVVRNPYAVAERLSIIDRDSQVRRMEVLEPAQVLVMRSFLANPRTIVLKDRQRGVTTGSCAAFVDHMLFRSPDYDRLIQTTHEGDAVGSLNSKIRQMVNNLPPAIRPKIIREVADELEYEAHPRVRAIMGWPKDAPCRAVFKQNMAGGRSQGRSHTFSHSHWTEMAFYGEGSAALSKESNAGGADEEVWASVNATIHKNPARRDIVESTANGPRGLFYRLIKLARQGSSRGLPAGAGSQAWSFVFLPWYYDNLYTLPVPPGFELNDEEALLYRMYAHKGLTLAHLAWRRIKREVEGYSLQKFQREYPSNPNEPFLSAGEGYFNQETWNRLTAWTNPAKCPATEELVILHPPREGRTYFGGFDTAGGTSRDFAALHWIDEDGRQVARWRSQKAKPDEQVRVGAKMSAMYNGGRILVELNKYGKVVDKGLRNLGVPVWRDAQGKGWWTQMGRTSQSKVELLDYINQLAETGALDHGPAGPGDPWITDPVVIAQALSMKERADGNIEADEDTHDDDFMGLALAHWNGRGMVRRARTPVLGYAADALADLKQVGERLKRGG